MSHLNGVEIVLLGFMVLIAIGLVSDDISSVRKARHLAKFVSERPELAKEVFGIEKIPASANDVRS